MAFRKGLACWRIHYLLTEEQRQRCWPVVFRVHHGFADESGTNDDKPVIAVAGWLATYETWIAFERDWHAVVDPCGGDFHSTDFWARQTYGADWPDQQRLDFVKSLAQIISRYSIYGVGIALVKAEFDICIPANVRQALKYDPYFFCLGHFISLIIEWYNRIPIARPPKPLRFMFDRKPGWEGFATTVFYQVQRWFDRDAIIGDMGFGKRQDEPALQAADLLVGELRRHLEGRSSQVLEILRSNARLLYAAPREKDLRARADALLAQIRSN